MELSNLSEETTGEGEIAKIKSADGKEYVNLINLNLNIKIIKRYSCILLEIHI